MTVMLLAGCGVPTEGGARLAGDDQVPFDLLSPQRGDAPSSSAAPTVGEASSVYFVQEDKLQPVKRDGLSTTATLIDALVRGPNDVEARLGLRTALLTSDFVRSTGVDGDVVVVELGPPFSDVTGHEQILALGQIVLTITSLPDVKRVRFEIDGETAKVTRADGSTVSGAVTRDDYAALVIP